MKFLLSPYQESSIYQNIYIYNEEKEGWKGKLISPTLTIGMAETSITPHVLIFPLPLQSTINSNLQLAELLCLAGLRVSFLNTNHNQQRLVANSNVESRFKQYTGFQFLTISDGLPEDNPRSGEQFGDIISSLQTMAEPYLKQMLSGLVKEPITCVILDGLFYYGVDIGNEMGVPVVIFDTISPSCFWIYLSLPKLIEAGVLPFKGIFKSFCLLIDNALIVFSLFLFTSCTCLKYVFLN